MNLASPRARLTVLVLTVVVVVLASVGAPYLQALDQEETTYPGYQPSELVPERSSAEGAPSVQPAQTRGTVLIDTQHSNRFDRSDIRPMVEAFADAGYRVEYTEFAQPISVQLKKADAFVVIDPSDAYDPEEAAQLADFADDGGRVLMVGEPTRSTIGLFGLGVLSVRSRMSSVSEPFGITFGSSYLYNMDRNDGNYLNIFASGTGRGQISSGVDEVVAYTGTHVSARDGTTVLRASDGTQSGGTGSVEEYSLAVVSGNALAVGDKAFLLEGSYNLADNDQFLANVVRFLTSGDREHDLLDFPYVVDRNPTVVYTSPELLGAAQEINSNLGSDRGEPRVELNRGTPDQQNADVLVTTFEDIATEGITNAGISAGGGRVEVGPYESDLDGVTIIHAPRSGYDLVVAADSEERVQEAAELLASGEFADHAITDRTVVIRDEDDVDVDTTPPEDTEPDSDTDTPTGNTTSPMTPPSPPGTPAG